MAPASRRPGSTAPPRWLAPGGWLSVELHNETLIVPDGLETDAERRFGKATLLLLRRPA